MALLPACQLKLECDRTLRRPYILRKSSLSRSPWLNVWFGGCLTGSNLPEELQGIFEGIESWPETNFSVVIQQARESYEVCFHIYIRCGQGSVGLAAEEPLLE